MDWHMLDFYDLGDEGDRWVWCQRCQRVWSVDELTLRWFALWNEFGISCADENCSGSGIMGSLLPYGATRRDRNMEETWPEVPVEGQRLPSSWQHGDVSV
jgi:hypothetical protein